MTSVRQQAGPGASRMTPARAARPGLTRWLPWLGYALALALAPLVLGSNRWVNMLSQMGCLIIICLSYNIKMGQGGMLSFGHAAYTGLGTFAVALSINHVSEQGLSLPLPFMPLAGGIFAALVSIPLGYVSTKKAGVTFAMISLGIGELLGAIAFMLPGVFGGDSGISVDRVYGEPFFGLSFGPQIQVYYLIAAYCFVCTALMYMFTATPLGRMLNAVRDNPERVAFIGYNTQWVRWFSFVVSGFFGGVGGGLLIINFEIFNSADAMGLMTTGAYLLFTFLGGATLFFGPILGAVLMVLAMVLMSELTSAWLLYLGLVFLLMVMYAPGGVASIIVAHARVLRSGRWRPLLLLYAGLLLAGAVLLLGASALVEMVYHHQLDAAMGSEVRYLRWTLDTASAATWLGMAALAAAGAGALELARRRFLRAWDAEQDTKQAGTPPLQEPA